MQSKVCEWCKKEFDTKKCDQRFCCRDCANKWHWESMKTLQEIVCETCWNKFYPKNYKRKFCSKECADKAKMIWKNCECCGKEFRPCHTNSRFCSQECYHKSGASRFFIPWQRSSKENSRFEKMLDMLWFDVEREFHLWKYYFDFKIWNTLIELNPHPFHNLTRNPIKKTAITKDYHYNKYKYAVDNWYKCIMVRDRTTNLIDMIKDDNFHYEWLPQLHYYNPKTKEHVIRKNRNKSRIDKWFVEIRDCGKETF